MSGKWFLGAAFTLVWVVGFLVPTVPAQLSVSLGSGGSDHRKAPVAMVFAAFAETNEQLQHTVVLAESLREFGGDQKGAPLWIFIPEHFVNSDSQILDRLAALGAEIYRSHTPPKAQAYYFSGKVFAAAQAETMASEIAAVLVWMDEDTVILQPPAAFALGEGIACAYRPVMHNRSGSRAAEPPNAFWSRIYELLGLRDEQLFSMVTPGDQETIRAYFNAGLLVVRPEYGVLSGWAEDFARLYNDSILAAMCRADVEKRIFLHQTALVGAVLNRLDRAQLQELPAVYNYPLFFHQQYQAVGEFGSIEKIVTLRYDTYFRDPAPDWPDQLRGPAKLIQWLVPRLGAAPARH